MDYMPEVNTVEKVMLTRAAAAQRPINGSLELLPLCNMNCDMCYIRLSRTEMEQTGRMHTADEWIRLGEEMAQSGVLFLLLTGGEPLMFPDFRRLYLELRRRGMILTVNTNGTLLDEEWAEFIGENKPRRINITLYGADDEAYRKLCHYPGGFEKALNAIRLLRERGVDVKINGSVTKENYKDMAAIYRIGQELDVPIHIDTYMLPGIHESDKSFDEQSRLNPEDAAAAEIEVMKNEMGQEFFQQYACAILSRLEEEDAVYPAGVSCMAGNCSFTVNWQGELRPCVSLSEPAVRVFETGFEAAWRKIVEETGKIRLNAKCSTCHVRHLCRTCAASALLETGDYGGVPDYMCRYAEESLKILRNEWEKIQEKNENGQDISDQ